VAWIDKEVTMVTTLNTQQIQRWVSFVSVIPALVIVGISVAGLSFGQETVYKCETADGVKFSPQPCSENADKVSPRSGSGGVAVLVGDEEVAESEASAHEGPVLKSLSGQVRDNKFWLHDRILNKKSPQQNCGQWIDRNGMLVIVPCNE